MVVEVVVVELVVEEVVVVELVVVVVVNYFYTALLTGGRNSQEMLRETSDIAHPYCQREERLKCQC